MLRHNCRHRPLNLWNLWNPWNPWNLWNLWKRPPYPPILITTADTDDRVSPGMAKKLAARLQAASPVGGPSLIRVETKAGHGAGKPVSKVIEEEADLLAFLFKYLEVR